MALSREQELRLRAAARRRRAQKTQAPQGAPDPLGLSAPEASQGRSGFDQFARGVGTGVSKLAGIVPGAAMELGNLLGVTEFEDVSGSNLLRDAGAPLGLTRPAGEEAQGLPGQVGEAIGQFGLPGVAGSMGLAARGTNLITGAARAPATGAGTRMLDILSEGAARAPGVAAGAELTGAAGEVIGREIAADAYGEGSWQSVVGSLTGGIVGSTAPTAAGTGIKRTAGWAIDNLPIASAVKNAIGDFFNLPASPAVMRRGQTRIYGEVDRKGVRTKGVTTDPEAAKAGLRGATDVEDDVLNPAQLTGDQGILSLAARDRTDSPTVLARWRGQVEESMGSLRERFQNLTGPERQALETKYHDQLDNMITVASANAQRRLTNMKPAKARSEFSRVMQQELVDAMRAARKEESALWGQVPDDMLMPAEVARGAYNRLRSQLGEITSKDMPETARRFLDPRSPETWLPPAEPGVQDTVTLGRLQELRSALLNEARDAGSGAAPNYNRARLARELAQSLRDDMLDLDPPEGEGTNALRSAINFSKRLNDRFTTGPVSQVLKKDRQGRYAVAPERALDVTVGKGKVDAELSTEAFVKALKSPSPAAKEAFNGYLEDDFMRMATVRGQGEEITEAGADRFMAKYADLFEKMPALRARFREAIDSGNLVKATRSLQEGDPMQMQARQIREIKRLTRGDKSGAVWQGFRERFNEKLLDRIAIQPSRTTGGMPILSGNRLRAIMNDPQARPALEAVYTPGELKSLNRMANTLTLIERDIMAQPAGSLSKDTPGVARTVMARLMGARAGQAAGSAMGGGAGMNLQAAQLGSGLFKKMIESGLRNPVERLISKALNDKQLLDALLVPPGSRQAEARSIGVINAWLADAVDQQLEEEWGLGTQEDARQGFERSSLGQMGRNR